MLQWDLVLELGQWGAASRVRCVEIGKTLDWGEVYMYGCTSVSALEEVCVV